MFKAMLPSVGRAVTRSYSYFWKPVPQAVPPCCWCVLPNGVRVITETTAAPIACVSMVVETGPRYETACNNGISHFIEHMAYKGFTTMKRPIFEEAIRNLGARLTCETTREMQRFVAFCSPDVVNQIICYFSRILYDLNMNDEDMWCERSIIEKEMEDAEKDPEQVMFDYLHESAFQGTPLAFRVMGPMRNIERFSRHYTQTYINEYYQPYRIIIASSGPLCHEEMVSNVQNMFGCLEAQSFAPILWPCRFTGSQIMFRNDDMSHCHGSIAFEAPGYTDENYYTMRLLKCIIGRWDKSLDLGNKTCPELAKFSAVSHLCDSYEAFYIPYRDVGLFGVYFVSKCMDVEDMMQNIFYIYMSCCLTLQHTDQERATNRLRLELCKEVDGGINSVLDMSKQVMYKNSRTSLPDAIERVDAIKSMELRAAADKYFYDRCPVVIGVGPTEQIPEYNRLRANTYWMRF